MTFKSGVVTKDWKRDVITLLFKGKLERTEVWLGNSMLG